MRTLPYLILAVSLIISGCSRSQSNLIETETSQPCVVVMEYRPDESPEEINTPRLVVYQDGLAIRKQRRDRHRSGLLYTYLDPAQMQVLLNLAGRYFGDVEREDSYAQSRATDLGFTHITLLAHSGNASVSIYGQGLDELPGSIGAIIIDDPAIPTLPEGLLRLMSELKAAEESCRIEWVGFAYDSQSVPVFPQNRQLQLLRRAQTAANKSVDPTTTAVTPPARQEPRHR